MTIIVTTGNTFTDIDGMACVLAYTMLLQEESEEARAVITGSLNHSIPAEVSQWQVTYSKSLTLNPPDRIVVMDVSEPAYLAVFLDESRIEALYDHHFGFETYWKERLGVNAHIEKVGSCATLIVEEWQKRLPKTPVPSHLAHLLAWAIISNTLNFQSSVTHIRDREALACIQPHITLSVGWIERYFQEHDAYIQANPQKAVQDDTKRVYVNNIDAQLIICQIELWNGEMFIKRNLEIFEAAASQADSPYYMVTIPSIAEGYNHIYCKNKKVQDILSNTIGAQFEGSIGRTPQLILRKEILRDIQ